MKFLVKKVCNGILDTNKERKRINTAFDDEPETKKHLLKLIETVEKMEWDKAREMIESKWWMGIDKKRECSRLEFIGALRLTDPDNPKHESIWFERMFDYMDLIHMMSVKEIGGKVYFVEPIGRK